MKEQEQNKEQEYSFDITIREGSLITAKSKGEAIGILLAEYEQKYGIELVDSEFELLSIDGKEVAK